MSTTYDTVEAANVLLAQDRTLEAINLVDRAALAGNRDAIYQLAIWQLIGNPLQRNVVAARRHLSCARKLGHIGAAFIEVALTANGSGGVSDWPRALDLLRGIALKDVVAQQHLALIDTMNLNKDGYPRFAAPFDRLDQAGLVLHYPKLLSSAECSHVAQASASLLKPAQVINPSTGRSISHQIRTSYGAVIGPAREDLVISAVNRRLAEITSTQPSQGEALAVLRYSRGQEFRLHSDAIQDAPNQRIITVLVYLNEGFSGGETVFPELDLKVTPREGDAIVFSNVLADGTIDFRLRHAGLPVQSGIKWLASRWIRSAAINPWGV